MRKATLKKVDNYDFIVIGAGIVGLTVSLELVRRYPESRIALIEKEAGIGFHASGRNSGVLHAGIYYGSDTLKAKTCSAGSRAMQVYAAKRCIHVKKTGKVIVASRPDAASQIDVLEERARKNGIRVERLGSKELKKIEPHAHSYGDALHSPDTAVIDSKAVLEQLRMDIDKCGITLFLNAKVKCIDTDNRRLEIKGSIYEYDQLINCAGVYADKIAHMFGVGRHYSIVPFRGSYYKLSSAKNSWVRGSIYPAPDTRYPFLGVHLTRGVDGVVYLGPTATPAWGRENYQGLGGIEPKELPLIFGRLARMYYRDEQNFRALVNSEIAKYSKKKFLQELQSMVPGLEIMDLMKCNKVGIRPQLVNTKTWKLEMDFIVEKGPNSIHVLNSISPAFTCAFEFAKLLVDEIWENRSSNGVLNCEE